MAGLGSRASRRVRALQPLAARSITCGRSNRTPIYLLTHPDLRHTPRVSAFFDYIITELEPVRPLLVRHVA
jgi:DNA-binding transcriptional LysR family regulator